MPFGTPPTLPAWNAVYESGGTWPAGDDAWFRALFDYRLFNLFVDAFNERAAVVGMSTIDHAVSGEVSMGDWANLQFKTQMLSQQAVVGYDGGGTVYDFLTPFDPTDPTYIFPVPVPLRRKFPREITSLSASGTDGWFARLVGGVAGSGPFYERVSSAWVLAAAGSKPDVLSDVWNGTGFDPDHGTFPVSGDYFGPWILTDLRDLLNSIVVFDTGDVAICTIGNNGGEFCTNSGVDAADYDSGVNRTTVPGLFAVDAGAGGGRYGRSCFYPVITGLYSGGLNRTIQLFTQGTTFSVFNAFGDPVTLDKYTSFHVSAATNATGYSAPKVGSLDRPNGTSPPPAEEYSSVTSTGSIYSIFTRWDVTDGFAYTKFT